MKTLDDTITARKLCRMSAAKSCGCCPYCRKDEPEIIDESYVSCIKELENNIDYYLMEYRNVLKMFDEGKIKVTDEDAG